MRVKQIRTAGRHSAPELVCALVLAVGLAGCSDPPAPATLGSPPPTASSSAAPRTLTSAMPADSAAESATTGLIALSSLPVKSRGVKTGYSRDQYGQAWTDDVPVDGGGNGCSTREDILRRDLTSVVMISASDDCKVLSGILDDQYTATVIPYVDGQSSPIDIDHLVSLSDSWQSGASSLSPELRQSLANDPLNLQAVSRQANQQKGDGDTATWLPPNKAYRCEYVQRQINVKIKYGLWVKPAEFDAMRRVLTGCGGIPPASLDSGSATPEVPAAAQTPATMTTTAAADTTGSAAQVTPPAGDSSDYFANCAAAKAAGRAPLLRGEAGYRPEMDGDSDGVACEVPR